MFEISDGSKFRVLFWCLAIAVVVYIIADIDRQRKDETEEVNINIEETLNVRKDSDAIGVKIAEIEQKAKEVSLEEHRKKLEEERAEEERLAKAKAEKERVARIKAEQVVASNTPTRGSRGRLLGTFEATAYTDNSRSQGKWVGQTATGMKPQVGVIAVDPKVIPYHTKLYIEGYGNAIAGDCGGAIKGNRLDLFMNTQKECMNFGRKNVKVWIRE